MGCCIAPLRWVCRIVNSLRSIFTRRNSEYHILPGGNDVQEEVEECEHIRNNEPVVKSGVDLQDQLNDMLETFITAGNNQNQQYEENSFQKKKEMEADNENSLNEFKESLKRTDEDFEHDKKLDEEVKLLQEELKQAQNRLASLRRRHESVDEENEEKRNELEEEFQKKLAEQNSIFEEKMRILKQKREEMEKQAEEEMQNLRYHSQEKIAVLLNCIQLRIRFDEKKEEWEDLLNGLRKLIITVVNSYYHLQSEIKNADNTDDFSKICIQDEGKRFAKKVVHAQRILSISFDDLQNLTDDFEDKIFIKIIMKALSEQGSDCHTIGNNLVEVLESSKPNDNLDQLDNVVSQLKPHSIPTTSSLMESSKTARDEDYSNMKNIPSPDWFQFFQ